MTDKPETETVVMPGGLMSAICTYLAQRPYREVATLFAALERCRPPDPVPAKEPTDG